jgi:hypothetical protein
MTKLSRSIFLRTWDAGTKYILWWGSLHKLGSSPEEIGTVKKIESSFDPGKMVPVVTWKDGYHYNGRLHLLKNNAAAIVHY